MYGAMGGGGGGGGGLSRFAVRNDFFSKKFSKNNKADIKHLKDVAKIATARAQGVPLNNQLEPAPKTSNTFKELKKQKTQKKRPVMKIKKYSQSIKPFQESKDESRAMQLFKHHLLLLALRSYENLQNQQLNEIRTLLVQQAIQTATKKRESDLRASFNSVQNKPLQNLLSQRKELREEQDQIFDLPFIKPSATKVLVIQFVEDENGQEKVLETSQFLRKEDQEVEPSRNFRQKTLLVPQSFNTQRSQNSELSLVVSQGNTKTGSKYQKNQFSMKSKNLTRDNSRSPVFSTLRTNSFIRHDPEKLESEQNIRSTSTLNFLAVPGQQSTVKSPRSPKKMKSGIPKRVFKRKSKSMTYRELEEEKKDCQDINEPKGKLKNAVEVRKLLPIANQAPTGKGRTSGQKSVYFQSKFLMALQSPRKKKTTIQI